MKASHGQALPLNLVAVPESQSMQAFHPRPNPPKKRKLGALLSRFLISTSKELMLLSLREVIYSKRFAKGTAHLSFWPNLKKALAHAMDRKCKNLKKLLTKLF